MKKLITLLILFVGMVSTVSATDYVTIRFYALREANWGDNVWIYTEYYNEDSSADNKKDFIAQKQMTWLVEAVSGKHMFYVDLDMDKALYDDAMNKYGIQIKFHNGSGTWTYASNEIKDFSKNYIFYIKKGGDYYQEYSTFDYKFAKYANSTLSDAVTLSPKNDVLTTTVDNEASVTATTYVLYPSFATDFGTPLKWELAISPEAVGDYWVNNFQTYSASLVKVSSNRGFLVKDVLAKNKFTFNLSTMSFTVEPYRTATIGYAGYLTYSNSEKYTVSGATAYTAKDMGTYAKLSAIDGSTVFPAGAGLLLRGSGEVTINAVASDASTATYTSNYASNNNLKGSGNSGASISEGCFVLYWDGTNPSSVCFRKTTSGDLAAHKAYLPAGSLAREFLSFEEGETTGIETVKASQKMNGEFFNLAGQRVAQPAKGLYIVNGKKVIMK